jgi:hypothetical protein
MVCCLDSPDLPLLQWDELMSVLANRLPRKLKNEVWDYWKFVSYVNDVSLLRFRIIIHYNCFHCAFVRSGFIIVIYYVYLVKRINFAPVNYMI